MRNQKTSTSQSHIQSPSSAWNESADVRFNREFFKYFDVNYHTTFWDDMAEEIVYSRVLNRHKEELHKVLFDMGFYSVDDNDPEDILYEEERFLESVQEYYDYTDLSNHPFGQELIKSLNKHFGSYVA